MIRLAENEQGAGPPLYQLKINLKWSKPAIWRRVLVRANTRLNRLHDLIQRVMPWTDSHLHQFIVGQISYGVPDPDVSFGSDVLNEKRYTLADLAPVVKKRFVYEYDFGDGWQHEILVEKILPPDPAFKRPVCLAGANACPPEDCGGIPGYYNLVEALANPKHRDHKEMTHWIGEKWDAEWFDLDVINDNLKGLKA